jgi:rare lipoprotein A
MGQWNCHRRFLFIMALAGGLVGLSGCGAPKKVVINQPAVAGKPPELYDPKPVAVLTGKASYYYGKWIGRLTANGEIYRAGDITAAHKTLPFNTMVRVTNLKNGESVIVRINNRGPYAKGRILDLSLEAAKRIRMTEAGVVPVRAEVLKKIPIVESPNLQRKPQPTASPSPSPARPSVKRQETATAPATSIKAPWKKSAPETTPGPSTARQSTPTAAPTKRVPAASASPSPTPAPTPAAESRPAPRRR